MVVAAVASALPLVVTIVMAGFYLTNRVAIAVQRQQIAATEAKTAELAGAVRWRESFKQEKVTVNGCLAEVSTALGTRVQWSPILITLVESMPDSMVLTQLEVKEDSVKRRVPMKNDPTKLVDANVLVKRLLISVSGDPRVSHDKAVKDFTERLRSSEVLGPKLEDITFAQKLAKIGDREMVSYEIDCEFKPQL